MAVDADAARIEWGNALRKAFSPAGVSNPEDGSLNQVGERSIRHEEEAEAARSHTHVRTHSRPTRPPARPVTNQEFFKPKRIIIQLNDPNKKKWGDAERAALLAGIEKHGIGKWREIIGDSGDLTRYDETTVRVKASKLMGTQSLARHVGWKGDQAAVEREYAKHKRIGEATGCWKSGYLVENEEGAVAKALEAWTD